MMIAARSLPIALALLLTACTSDTGEGARKGLSTGCPPGDEFCAAGFPGDAGDDGDDDREADLPYDVRPQVGDVFRLSDAFLEEGPLPDTILDVTMEEGDWRLVELRSDTPFVITEADCTHVGNRDIGRDRIFVTWQDPDGSTETDHLDMRYCKE